MHVSSGRLLEARAELREVRREHERRVTAEKERFFQEPNDSWDQRASAVRASLKRQLEADVLRWRLRFRDVAANQLRQIEDVLDGFWRIRGRGDELVAAVPGLADGRAIRGFQVEPPEADPYRVGLDAPSDRYSPEELVLAHTGREPLRWLPEEEELR